MDENEYHFQITLNTSRGESVGVVGSCPQLGSWHFPNGVLLTRRIGSGDNYEVWTGAVRLPSNEEIQFRYFTCIVVEETLIVRRWEANILPRTIISGNGRHNAHLDLFGTYFGETRVNRGWLTKETIVQFKLFSEPIQMWKKSLRGKSFRVKVTPLGLNFPNLNLVDDHTVEDSMDVQEVRTAIKSWPIVEVANMSQGSADFKLQEQFGRPLESGDFLVFQVQVLEPETMTFLVDFYAHTDNPNDVPDHIGFCYILQNNLIQNAGMATVPITNSKHLAIGQLKVEYLIVRPIENFECDMSVSYARHWKHSWRGLEVGHRGAGSSFKDALKSCASIRENTIASLAYAANHGADMIEFDVQLSKDMVPVIYHDFHVCIAMKKKMKSGNDPHDLLKLPLKDLTYAQLQMLKVYHLKEYDMGEKFNDDDFDDHQPFPTLQSSLERLEPHVGFNVEIKWTMQLKDGTYELNHPFELNTYVDTILKPILQYGGSRKIVFSCFHPDICTMIRLKQNKYPVMFLTQGITSRYSDYHDPRTRSIPMAVNFARHAGLLGINVHTEDILRDPTQVVLVQEQGLVLFCWGEDNNDSGTIRYLKNIGLNGIIYDKIDEFSSKEIKESIFLVEARESQKELLKLASIPAL